VVYRRVQAEGQTQVIEIIWKAKEKSEGVPGLKLAQRKDIKIEERQKYEVVERQNRQTNEENITRWATMRNICTDKACV